MPLIRVILIGFIVYFALRYIFRSLFSFSEDSNQNKKKYNNRKEGDITIENVSQKSSSKKDQGGEFVDFEEID